MRASGESTNAQLQQRQQQQQQQQQQQRMGVLFTKITQRRAFPAARSKPRW
jgi:hypothetical protein